MKQNFIKLIFKILFLTSLGFFINFYIDPYGVIGNNLEYQSLEPNQNYMKTKYILRNPNKFEGFIFGSSRVGNIPTENIINYKFYNMTYSEGLPQEWEQTLNIFIKNNIIPKIIIIGIDDFDFKINPQIHEKQLMRKPYIKVNILKDYILINPFMKYSIKKLKNILFFRKDNSFKNDFLEHGRLFKKLRIQKEKEIEDDQETHLKKEVFKKGTDYSSLENIQKETAINSLINIDKICKENKIKLIFLFNPVHPTSYKNDRDKNEYRKIREEIKSKFFDISIYDFAEHEITKNNLYWFETSHFNTKVGEIMLENIKELKVKARGRDREDE